MTLKEKFYKVLMFNEDIYPLEECGQIADNYAVAFAEWLNKTESYFASEDQYHYHGTWNNCNEMLEIFKKEQKWK